VGVGLAVGGGVRGVAGGEGTGGAATGIGTDWLLPAAGGGAGVGYGGLPLAMVEVLVLVLPPLEVLKLPLPALALVLLPLLELDEPLLALALALAPFEVCDITAGSRARATAATSRHSAAGDVTPATLPRQTQQLSFVYLRILQVYPKEGDNAIWVCATKLGDSGAIMLRAPTYTQAVLS